MSASSCTRALRSARGLSGVRHMATASASRAGSSSAASSPAWLKRGIAAAGVVGATYSMASFRSPIHNDSRPSFADRLKSPTKQTVINRPSQPEHEEEEDDETAPETPASIEVAEEESESQSAYNPDTGEINWDCPCLGGMAHGPCGEEFKAAFSCFVYSEEEPKGIDCVEKFKSMQDCFRKYPEIYKEEIEDDERAEAELEKASQSEQQQKEEDQQPKSTEAAAQDK